MVGVLNARRSLTSRYPTWLIHVVYYHDVSILKYTSAKPQPIVSKGNHTFCRSQPSEQGPSVMQDTNPQLPTRRSIRQGIHVSCDFKSFPRSLLSWDLTLIDDHRWPRLPVRHRTSSRFRQKAWQDRMECATRL